MKPTILVGLVMLGLGFAIGWVAKPESAGSKPEQVAQSHSGRKAGLAVEGKGDEAAPPITRTEREEKPKPKPGEPSPEQREQGRKIQAEMTKKMVSQLRTKFEKQIEKMATALNLTPEQKSALMASLDEKLKAFDKIDFNDPKSLEGLNDAMKGLSNKALEDQVASSLSADQKIAMADFKERELQAKGDTSALKGLSKLQGVLEFEEGQRDEVYKLLAEDAQKSAKAEEEDPDVSKLFTEGMGFEMDPYDLGLQKVMTDTVGLDNSKLMTGTDDEKRDIAGTIRQRLDARIEQKVDVLRPALNEKQLDQYRTELKTKGLGFYGTMLETMEKGGAN